MCGRFTLTLTPETLRIIFGIPELPPLSPRYNIAPTQPVLIVRTRAQGGREAVLARWGLVPSWAKDPAIGNKLINARSESVFEKPSFRHAIRGRRCIVPASGFYEWHTVEGTGKQPRYVTAADGGPLAFAGLWEEWRAPDGGTLESCCILTTAANSLVAAIHDRMPVILPPEAYGTWLDPGLSCGEELARLLGPAPPEELAAVRVSTLVNSPGNDSPRCLEAIP